MDSEIKKKLQTKHYMKKLSIALAFISFALSYCQKVEDYANIFVPVKFDDMKTENKYNLNKMLVEKLKSKKFNIIQDETIWNHSNPCNGLRVDLKDTSTMFRTKINITFSDCNGKIISTIPGTTTYKEYDLGFRDALSNATQKIGVSAPKEPIATKEINQSTTSTTSVETKTTAIEYENNGISYHKIDLGSGNFNLTNPKNNQIFAVLKPTSKKGIYLVLFSNGEYAVGFEDANYLIIDNPSTDNKTITSVIFNKK